MSKLVINKCDRTKEIILRALDEDIGNGDVTTLATISRSQILYGEFIAKDSGVISGLNIAKKVFKLLNRNIEFKILLNNGSLVKKGQILANIKGHGASILTGERIALNFLQRMSGIATMTKRYVDAVKETKAIILDTRKTVPGLRVFDKQAVKDGGGQNHRFGLFDMFLIKDNHIIASGSITNAIKNIRKSNKQNLSIEIEVKNFQELKEALSQKPNRIMLDNMDIKKIRKAVKLIAGQVPIEVSGGINLKTVSAIAKTGVNYISVGALTHSVKALDISLEIKNI